MTVTIRSGSTRPRPLSYRAALVLGVLDGVHWIAISAIMAAVAGQLRNERYRRRLTPSARRHAVSRTLKELAASGLIESKIIVGERGFATRLARRAAPAGPSTISTDNHQQQEQVK